MPIVPPAGRTGRPGRDPDVGDGQLAGVRAAGLDQVAQLGGVEGDGSGGVHRAALEATPVDASTPEAMSQATTGQRGAVDRLDRRCRRVTRDAGEARPEDRVDDRPGAGEQIAEQTGLRPHRLACVALEVGGRVGAELVADPRAAATSTSMAALREQRGPRPARRRRCCPCRR